MEDTFNLLKENISNLLAFANECQDEIMSKGRNLTADELAIAKMLNIKSHGKIRILVVEDIPRSLNPVLNELCDKLGFINNEEGKQTRGITFGNGIYTRKGITKPFQNIVHELVHVSQYEKLGGIKEYMAQYILEIQEYFKVNKTFTGAKRNIPLELEAYDFVKSKILQKQLN